MPKTPRLFADKATPEIKQLMAHMSKQAGSTATNRKFEDAAHYLINDSLDELEERGELRND